jgi:hypothetical protein
MCISSQNPLDVNKDYFPANTRVAVDGAIAGTATVTVAGDFSITYHKYFKVVKNLQTDPVKTYILRICGSDAPTKYPDGTAIEAGAKHFSVPVKGVGIGGSTPSAFLEPLDLLDEVKLADVTYAHSPCLHAAQVAGDITQESANFASKAASETSVELVLTDKWNTGTCNCDKDVVFDASGDDTPLGRAEWIKFLATFFNEEDRANLVFSREKSAYDATKALAAAAAALYELTKAKKKCAWVNGLKVDMAPTKTRTAPTRAWSPSPSLQTPVKPSKRTAARPTWPPRWPTSTSSSTRPTATAIPPRTSPTKRRFSPTSASPSRKARSSSA